MSLLESVRRVANSLLSGIQLANRQDFVDSLFKEPQAFLWCEGKRPADDRQVHAVFAVIGKRREFAHSVRCSEGACYLHAPIVRRDGATIAKSGGTGEM